MTENHPRRALLEQFIHQCFARRYGADIHQFMPYLIAWRQPQFIAHVAEKGRFAPLMQTLPVRVVIDPDAALLGAAHIAASA